MEGFRTLKAEKNLIKLLLSKTLSYNPLNLFYCRRTLKIGHMRRDYIPPATTSSFVASIAQLGERSTEDRKVTSSILVRGNFLVFSLESLISFLFTELMCPYIFMPID